MDIALFGFLVLLGGLAALGWLVWQMLLQQGRLLLRLETLESLGETHDQPRTVPMEAFAPQRNVNGAPAMPGPPADPKVGGVAPDFSPPDDSEPGTTFTLAVPRLAKAATQPTEAEGKIELTIGMATYNDFDGVYFTLQALRLYQDLEQTELLVIDNYGCQHTQHLVEGWLGARYIRATDVVGTAAPRDLVFREARGNAVLCCDCHVLFPPGVIAQLKQFYREHPACQDLLQGPMLYDDGKQIATHFDPVWRAQMWGTWGSDPRGRDSLGEPFDIPMQGLGVFSCLKSAWLGFHPQFLGFGGEEGYIHEKFRQAGRRCLCLPWLRWMHRFSRPSGVIYPLTVEHKLRNYVIGHEELGLDLDPVLQHFSHYLSPERVLAVTETVRAGKW
jgi:Glycosyl transferase family 2